MSTYSNMFECFFSLLSANDAVNLIKAALLEKTLIFVGPEHLTSAFTLGLNQLIFPFKWCFSLIPILPIALLDMIDAPVPLIVGITKLEYEMVAHELDSEDFEDKVWVFLDVNKCPRTKKCRPIRIENLERLLDND